MEGRTGSRPVLGASLRLQKRHSGSRPGYGHFQEGFQEGGKEAVNLPPCQGGEGFSFEAGALAARAGGRTGLPEAFLGSPGRARTKGLDFLLTWHSVASKAFSAAQWRTVCGGRAGRKGCIS